jgi:hypothetical protein
MFNPNFIAAGHAARSLIIRLPEMDISSGGSHMQTVIRPLALAVAALSLAGSALAASPPATPQSTAQPTSASAAKPAKSKSQAPTTLVATGKIVQFDATGQALTLATSKGEQHFTVGPSTHLEDSSHAITFDDLGKLAGHKATVRYKESAGEKSVESIRVSSSAAKTSTKG